MASARFDTRPRSKGGVTLLHMRSVAPSPLTLAAAADILARTLHPRGFFSPSPQLHAILPLAPAYLATLERAEETRHRSSHAPLREEDWALSPPPARSRESFGENTWNLPTPHIDAGEVCAWCNPQGQRARVCAACAGHGFLSEVQRGGWSAIRSRCPVCAGDGLSRDNCFACSGDRLPRVRVTWRKASEELLLQGPPGLRADDLRRLAGEPLYTEEGPDLFGTWGGLGRALSDEDPEPQRSIRALLARTEARARASALLPPGNRVVLRRLRLRLWAVPGVELRYTTRRRERRALILGAGPYLALPG